MTGVKNMAICNAVKAADRIKYAFRYYNYIREFYGYLLDSIGFSLEPDNCNFDPAAAPAEKVFPPTVDEKTASSEQVASDRMNRAIRAFERMIEIVSTLNVEEYEQERKNREWGLQDPEKFALTSIAEMLFVPSMWFRFSDQSQDVLCKLANEAQSDVMLMDALSLDEHISKIFVEQKKCLETFLPQQLDELRKLKAEMGF